MPKTPTYDVATITALLDEARKGYNRSKKQFDKHDNHEDMHKMESWGQTVRWLESKLPKT